MSKWRFTPLILAACAALVAFTTEARTLASEVATLVTLLGLVLFLFLFATRHRVQYRAGGDRHAAAAESRRIRLGDEP